MKIWIPILIAASASSASAQVCGENSLQESLQYLRRLSLDLRGRVPDMAELESVVANNGAIDPSIIRSIVRSEAMITQIHQHHRDLLWTNITDQRIVDQSWTLANIQRPAGVTGDIVLQTTSQTRRRAYRGGNVPCLDEAARFYRRARRIDPGNPRVLSALGSWALAAGDPARAELYLTRARALESRSARVVELGSALGPVPLQHAP